MDFDLEAYKLKQSNEALRILVGKTLKGLRVFADHWVLDFHDASVTVRTQMYFRAEGKTVLPSAVEWLDEVCSCIGKVVAKAEQQHDSDLVVGFENGASLFLSLRTKDRLGAPCVYLKFENSW